MVSLHAFINSTSTSSWSLRDTSRSFILFTNLFRNPMHTVEESFYVQPRSSEYHTFTIVVFQLCSDVQHKERDDGYCQKWPDELHITLGSQCSYSLDLFWGLTTFTTTEPLNRFCFVALARWRKLIGRSFHVTGRTRPRSVDERNDNGKEKRNVTCIV